MERREFFDDAKHNANPIKLFNLAKEYITDMNSERKPINKKNLLLILYYRVTQTMVSDLSSPYPAL